MVSSMALGATTWSGSNVSIGEGVISEDVVVSTYRTTGIIPQTKNSTITIPAGVTVTINGNLTINNNQTLNVKGNLIVTGSVTNNGTNNISGKIDVGGTYENKGTFSSSTGLNAESFTNSGNATISGGNLIVSGALTNSKTLEVSNGNVSAESISITGGSSKTTVSGALTSRGTISTSGTVTVGDGMQGTDITTNGTLNVSGGRVTASGNFTNGATTTFSGDNASLIVDGKLSNTGSLKMAGSGATITASSANATGAITMGNNATISSTAGDLTLARLTVGTGSNITSAGSLKTTGGTFGNNTTIAVADDFTNGSTFTIGEGVDLDIPGDFVNNGTATIEGNLKVAGDVTNNNNATINMNGGIMRIGSYAADGSLEGGNLTLNNGSKLYYNNNSGKVSNVEVRGNLNGGETAYIKSQNGGKGNLIVSGTYTDEVEDLDTYHPDWGLDVERTLITGSITSISFKMKENANIVLGTNNYEMPTITTGFWNNLEELFVGTSTAKEAIKEIQNQYNGKPMNEEVIAEIIRQISVALPIELVYFSAQQDDNTIVFEWETASELNNDYFTIEYSTNVANWYKAKTVAGAGTTQLANEYSTSVAVSTLPQGTVYFRLSQTDYNGTTTSFDVVAVEVENAIDEQIDVVVYPNPTTSVVNIKGAESLNVSVINSNGSVENLHQMADNQYSVEYLRKGIYTLVIETQAGVVSKQLVKQ